MDAEFINLATGDLAHERLCCIIRGKKPHPGIDAKWQWFSDRLKEGHVSKKLNAKAIVFIEYVPLEMAWVLVIGDDYYYPHCLWVSGSCKGKGHGKSLMEYCSDDTKAKGKSGICMLGAEKQKHWLSDQASTKEYGPEVVSTADQGYELLALPLDGTKPRFAQNVKGQEIENKELTIYYDMQRPYVRQNIEIIKQYREQNDTPVSFIYVDTLQKTEELPCVLNNRVVFCKGKFETMNLLLDIAGLERILKKQDVVAILPRASQAGNPVKRMILCRKNALHIAAMILTVDTAKRYLYFQQSGADPQIHEAEGGNAKPSIVIKPSRWYH